MQKIVFFCSLVLILQRVACNPGIELFEDEKTFKSLLKTRPNLLVMFSKSDEDARESLKIFKEVGKEIKGKAAIAYSNCE